MDKNKLVDDTWKKLKPNPNTFNFILVRFQLFSDIKLRQKRNLVLRQRVFGVGAIDMFLSTKII